MVFAVLACVGILGQTSSGELTQNEAVTVAKRFVSATGGGWGRPLQANIVKDSFASRFGFDVQLRSDAGRLAVALVDRYSHAVTYCAEGNLPRRRDLSPPPHGFVLDPKFKAKATALAVQATQKLYPGSKTQAPETVAYMGLDGKLAVLTVIIKQQVQFGPALDDTGSATYIFEAKSQRLFSFRQRWVKRWPTKTEKALTAFEAKQAFVKQIPRYGGGPLKVETGLSMPTDKPGYAVRAFRVTSNEDCVILDAVTGKFLKNAGPEINAPTTSRRVMRKAR